MYAKIFAQVFDSSIADNYRIRHFFMDLLVLADENGIVDATPEAISCRTRIPLKDVQEYLKELEKPDTRSRSKEEKGKRIVPIDPERGWGWKIVNHGRYRAIKTRRDRSAYMAEYMRRKRSEVANMANKVANDGLTLANPASAYECTSVPVQERGAGETIPSQKQQAKFEIDTRFTWLEAELCRFYKRPRCKVSMGEEEYAVMEICRRPDVKLEWSALQSFRKESGERYFPQSLLVLCRDWDKTLDRARNHAPAPKTFKEKSIIEKDLDAFYAREGL